MTSSEIQKVLKAHAAWLRGENGGARASLYGADLSSANLTRASLYGADLSSANLTRASLYGADLSGANLYGANLYGANLRVADLRSANLLGVNLYGANLRGAKFSVATYWPAPTMLLVAKWGDVTDALTTAMMRLDAACHPDPAAFNIWAVEGHPCPYASVRFERAANFLAKRSLWSPGSVRPWEVVQVLLDTYLTRDDS